MNLGTGLLLADLAGVAVFAASGGSAAVAKRLDLFGVVFVGFVAALGGGIVRDLVIDEVPPLAFADWRYAVTAAVASAAVFWLHPQLTRLRRTVLVLDAAGFGLFAVTVKALEAGVPPVGVCRIGNALRHRRVPARDLLTGGSRWSCSATSTRWSRSAARSPSAPARASRRRSARSS